MDLLGPLHLPDGTGDALHAALDGLQSFVRHVADGDLNIALHGADAGGEPARSARCSLHTRMPIHAIWAVRPHKDRASLPFSWPAEGDPLTRFLSAAAAAVAPTAAVLLAAGALAWVSDAWMEAPGS